MVGQPSNDEVHEQLARILASEEFSNSPAIRKFLKYIVNKTLAGEQSRLKGFSIGVDVFERGEQFDPQADTIVRVQARNLRRALKLYNLGSGLNDPIKIRLHKGSYIPAFSHHDGESIPENLEGTEFIEVEKSDVEPTPKNGLTIWLRPGIIFTGFGLLILLVLFWVRNPT